MAIRTAKRLQILLPLNNSMVILLHYNGIAFPTHHMGRALPKYAKQTYSPLFFTSQNVVKSFPIDAIPLVCENAFMPCASVSGVTRTLRQTEVARKETVRRKQCCVAIDVNIAPLAVTAVVVPLHADFMFLFVSVQCAAPHGQAYFAFVICPHSVGIFSMILQQSFLSLWRIQSRHSRYIFCLYFDVQLTHTALHSTAYSTAHSTVTQ